MVIELEHRSQRNQLSFISEAFQRADETMRLRILQDFLKLRNVINLSLCILGLRV